MTTEYTQRVTIACPEALIAECNELVCALGEATADRYTLVNSLYKDIDDNHYAVLSTSAKPIMMDMADDTLVAPAHTPDVDLQIASDAQTMLSMSGPAGPDIISIVVGDRTVSPTSQIDSLGLELIGIAPD